MKIIFVGGGTAGHINPALALACYVKEKEPNSEILYVGAKGGMEEKLVEGSVCELVDKVKKEQYTGCGEFSCRRKNDR